MHNTAIIGSGPAGWTAAIYAARAGMQPVLFTSSVNTGGDLATTTDVENFPGFPAGITGPDLMDNMAEQARRFGTTIVTDDVTAVELEGPVKRLTLSDGSVVESRSVILATGAQYRSLGLSREQELTGHGVSWCATCDGFFFREKSVVVVGGGDTALEEALFLSKFASRVTVIHRRSELRASVIMQDRAFSDPKISFVWDSEVTGLLGDAKLSGVEVMNLTSGQRTAVAADGLFIAIGRDPRTHLFAGQVTLSGEGTVAVAGRSSATNLPGVFAAGDVVDAVYRQAITAAASGCTAAIDAERFLATHGAP